MNNILIFALFILLLVFLLLTKRTNLLGVYKLFIFLALAEIPYLIYISQNVNELNPFVLIYIRSFDSAFQFHIILKAFFLSICLTSMLIFKTKAKFLSNCFDISGRSATSYMYLSLLFFLVTIIIYTIFLNQIGGLLYLISNFSNKTLVVQGTGWYRNGFLITSMLSTGMFILALKTKRLNRFFWNIIFFILLLTFFSILASVGERKNPLILLFFSMAMWHFNIKPILIFRLRYLFLGLIFIAFAATAPALRKEGATDLYLKDPKLLLSDSAPYIGELFKRFSEVDISLFIYSYFDERQEFWRGSTWPDLITGIIPSAYYENKPPLDEGVYIYNLAHFVHATPQTPFNELIPVGWPLSRVTSGYAHFGIVGVLIYAILTGIILKYIYVSVERTKSPQAVALYSLMMISSFGISNAFIANTLVILLLLIMFSVILKIFTRRKKLVSD